VLRVHPHRGDIVAAGVVVLTLFALLVDARFGGEWSDGVRFLFTGAIAAVVVMLALSADAGDEVPRPYESVIYVASFVLLVQALTDLAQLLGSADRTSAGTVVWVGALLLAYCAYFVAKRNSAIMTLLGALTAVVVVVAFVEWVFDPDSVTTFRWILLVCAGALTLAAVQRRDAARRHAVSLVDAAGFTAIAIGATLVAEQLVGLIGLGFLGDGGGSTGGPAGWELVLLAFGFGLIAYGCVDRERVPPFLGIVVLGFYFFLAFQPGKDGPSLMGWPLVLLVLAGILLAIGLRPRQDLPPEPPVPPPAPTTPPPAAPTAIAEP
jgi:hypothetical protein